MAEAAVRQQEVSIPVGRARLRGALVVPPNARGVVLFAHGSGSGRASPRNNFVAGVLREAGLGTLLIDLLEEREAHDRGNVFDIDLLAERVLGAARWLREAPECAGLGIGYFGASTGAAAALQAAAREPQLAGAVVSRGGRPDLAARHLPQVQAPTLLIVGGRDAVVLDLNEEAFSLLRCEKALEVIPGATHLFEEPGALERAAELAAEWFRRQLAAAD